MLLAVSELASARPDAHGASGRQACATKNILRLDPLRIVDAGSRADATPAGVFEEVRGHAPNLFGAHLFSPRAPTIFFPGSQADSWERGRNRERLARRSFSEGGSERPGVFQGKRD